MNTPPSTPHSAVTSPDAMFEEWVRKEYGGESVGRVGVHRLREAFRAGVAAVLPSVSETGRITELESKLAAMESALKGASNYIADSETHPQRIEFADGRVVAMKGQGYLYVSRKEAE